MRKLLTANCFNVPLHEKIIDDGVLMSRFTRKLLTVDFYNGVHHEKIIDGQFL